MRSFVRFVVVSSAAVAATVSAGAASAAEAGPSDYTTAVAALKPGDTLNLAPGAYTKGLTISGLNGTKDAPITIKGPSTAVFAARSCCNTVEITNSSYVVLEGFTLDGKDLPGIFGVSAKGGSANLTHHVTLEGLTIVGHGGSQQTVGISTKTPTWGWVIRNNRILGPGTGMYLGDSDGSDAFFDAIIEGNLVKDCTGYCVQIKHQTARPPRDGQPTDDSRTILRHNVFIKNDAPSPDGDRPNLLIGGFPASGVGSKDQYEIYGNLFFHNPRESLLQASGRVSIHDNVFVDVKGTAIYLVSHNGPLRLAHVYNNTIYSAGTGVRFVDAATEGDAVFGNLVFATNGIVGTVGSKSENLELPVASAAEHVKEPSLTLGAMDFYPLPGKCTGAALPLSLVAGDVARAVDFNGTAKAPPIYRGAYHGSGANPGWALDDDRKPLVAAPGGGGDAGPPDDGGADAGSGDSGASTDDGGLPGGGDGGGLPGGGDGDPSAAPTGDVDEAGGCTASAGRASSASVALVALALSCAIFRRRRRGA